MKKYTIVTQAIVYQSFTVEAEDKKKASEILYSGEAYEDDSNNDVLSVNIESITEVVK